LRLLRLDFLAFSFCAIIVENIIFCYGLPAKVDGRISHLSIEFSFHLTFPQWPVHNSVKSSGPQVIRTINIVYNIMYHISCIMYINQIYYLLIYMRIDLPLLGPFSWRWMRLEVIRNSLLLCSGINIAFMATETLAFVYTWDRRKGLV